jgi:hypothetical protein
MVVSFPKKGFVNSVKQGGWFEHALTHLAELAFGVSALPEKLAAK